MCLCGSGSPEAACCGPYLRRESLPPTALALMRSRYSAFASADYEYLVFSHDPETCEVDVAVLRAGSRRLSWTGLQVESVEAGGVDDELGSVTFRAKFFDGRKAGELYERSRFRRIDGRWVYVSGSRPIAARQVHQGNGSSGMTPGRNAPCSCGSGRKYKRCCGS